MYTVLHQFGGFSFIKDQHFTDIADLGLNVKYFILTCLCFIPCPHNSFSAFIHFQWFYDSIEKASCQNEELHNADGSGGTQQDKVKSSTPKGGDGANKRPPRISSKYCWYTQPVISCLGSRC